LFNSKLNGRKLWFNTPLIPSDKIQFIYFYFILFFRINLPTHSNH